MITIEPAKPEDAEAIYKVQHDTWLDTYPNKELGITERDIRLRLEGEHGERIAQKIAQFREGIENNHKSRAFFVARQNDEIVGYIAPSVYGGQHRVGSLYVLPKAQGQGIGGQLLEKAIAWHDGNDIYLRVASYNQNAINFYKKHGFVETGRDVSDDLAQTNGEKEIPEIEMVRRVTNTV